MAMRQTKLTDLWNASKVNQPSSASKTSFSTNSNADAAVLPLQSENDKNNTVKSPNPASPASTSASVAANSNQLKRKVSVVELSSDDDDAPNSQPLPEPPSITSASVSEDACSSDVLIPSSSETEPKTPFAAPHPPQSHASSDGNAKIAFTMRSRLTSRFRGSMLGALLGDCYGSRSEGRSHIAKLSLINSYIRKGISRYQRFNIVLPYTDDTAMCHGTAASLLACGDFDPRDMSRRYAENYFEEPDRGYGGNIGNTFKSWRDGQYQDVFESARQQFGGRGSYGNGAAMRIAPVPLFFHGAGDRSRLLKMVEVTLQSSRLTHTNMDGYNGGLLQALAIECALQYGLRENREDFSPINFVRTLEQEFVKYAESDEPINTSTVGPGLVGEQLRRLVDLIEHEAGRPVPANIVVRELGNGVAAHKSVPTAIYAFLWGTYDADIVAAANNTRADDNEDVLPDRYSPLQRTLVYAISLGGDADTIASMAGAISGAFYGTEAVPRIWYESCEAWQRTLDHSDDMVNNVLAVIAK